MIWSSANVTPLSAKKIAVPARFLRFASNRKHTWIVLVCISPVCLFVYPVFARVASQLWQLNSATRPKRVLLFVVDIMLIIVYDAWTWSVFCLQYSSAGRRAVMLHGLPALTYVTKKACGQRHSSGAGGGDYTAAGRRHFRLHHMQ